MSISEVVLSKGDLSAGIRLHLPSLGPGDILNLFRSHMVRRVPHVPFRESVLNEARDSRLLHGAAVQCHFHPQQGVSSS
jgi:hypothetical protein